MGRTILDLDARATVLDAAERLARVPPDGDIAFVVAPGAPILRSEVFIEVLRSQAAPRRVSIVTADARARSLASAVHVPAYATVAALERRELDPTEQLTIARKAAIAAMRPAGARALPPLRRTLAVLGSLAGAALILAAVVLPEARVIVAPAAEPLGPFDIAVRAGPGGDLVPKTLTAPVNAKVTGTATGSRTEEIRGKGTVQLANRTTNDVRVPKGTIFKTADGTQFLSTDDATIPRSVIAGPFELVIGRVGVGVEAFVAGPPGNVPAGRIVVSPDPQRYAVTNPEATSGGEIKKIPVVKLEDYDAAAKRAPDALRAAAEGQLASWVREPRAGEVVVQRVSVRQTSIAPATVDLVAREVETFDLNVGGIATAYSVPESQPKEAALKKLGETVAPGNEIDPRATAVDVKSATIGDDGITWQLSVRAIQVQRVDRPGIARLLAARPVREAQRALADQDLVLVRLEWVPAWSPILPLLDARITVEVEPASLTSGP